MTKKEMLIKTGLEMFAHEGYEGVGVLKIVEAAGVTKPTMYHYFGSKEGLLKSIYEVYFSDLLNLMKEAASYSENVMETISGLVNVYVSYAKDNSDFFWLSHHLRSGPLKSESHLIVEGYHKEEQEVLFALMAEISQVHSNLKGMEELLAINFMSLVSGFIENNIKKGTLDQVSDTHVEYLTKQFLYGIFSL